MAAATSFQQYNHSFTSPVSYNPSSSTSINTPIGSTRNKLPTFTSIRSLSNDERGTSRPRSSRQHSLRSTLRSLDTKMSSSVATTTATTTTDALPIAAARRADSQQTRLHKRHHSSSSLNNSPAVPNAPYSHFATPYATYEEEPFPDVAPSTPGSSTTPKIKPYLRKLSSTGKEAPDQGRLDLSKSVSENSAVAGLGITDFAALPRTDSLHSGRTKPHARNTSVGSNLSSGSGSFRPTQHFVHPMRQVPNRPYTPATDASSTHDEETAESNDIVSNEDMPPALSSRMGRSGSLSSIPAMPAPTPLSQSHTAADLGQVPKLTSTSQSNLSIHSSRSRSRLGRPRGDTNRSIDYKHSTPSSRTSLDKTFSFVSRRSDHDDATQTRDERIQAARRKFEEKEAHKTRKAEEEEFKRQQSEHLKSVKRQERQRRQSTASAVSAASSFGRPRIPKMQSSRSLLAGREEALKGLRYDQSKVTALPRQGTEPGKSEKRERDFGVGRLEERERSANGGGWNRFSAWMQTRVLGCGRKR